MRSAVKNENLVYIYVYKRDCRPNGIYLEERRREEEERRKGKRYHGRRRREEMTEIRY